MILNADFWLGFCVGITLCGLLLAAFGIGFDAGEKDGRKNERVQPDGE